MRVYIKFLILLFLKNLFFVTLVMLSLVFILNTLSELEFFSEYSVDLYFPIYISLLNSPSLLFEMFPFIFLISTQLFFISLFNNNEVEIFKYTGLKNTSILKIIGILSFFIGIFLIIFFYNFSSSLKNYYLKIKSNYQTDGKYLAVITNNGLWIKDIIDEKITIINASKIDENYLINTFITEFTPNYEVIKNIKSNKIDISTNEWIIFDAKIYEKNSSREASTFRKISNFDYNKIKNLFSNLSSLSLKDLFELRHNYKLLNYSTTEVDVQINKIISYPFYLMLMTVFSAIIMFSTKKFKSYSLKIALGLFSSVIIYYTFNFFNVMGNTERISIVMSVWTPVAILLLINFFMLKEINAK